ncbi:H/ACA ribonucleoprotein complex non-core subunit NAF1 [Elgaria multicarinata webbii]|uniref:H/ACA ribonucleoprotein complex non-core subunit NAF1 n=1 Tax=Elgaria multicarinata webbii TaxID=159646 RepID=UPI002FCD4417
MDYSGVAGWEMTERLQTLSVVAEGSPTSAAHCPPGPVLKEGEEGAALGAEGRLAGDPAPSQGLPAEPEPTGAAPAGGDVEERRAQPPGLCLGPVEPPALATAEPGSWDAAVEGEPPPLGPGSGAGGEPGEKPRQDPAEGGGKSGPVGEVEEKSAPGSSSSSSVAFLNSSNDLKGEGLDGGSGPAALETGKAPAVEVGKAPPESDSETESDTDSSSSSSSSSCLPMLSEDDDQQHKNENYCSIRKKGGMSEQDPLPVEDLIIILPESVELMSFGKVSSIIEHLVIIESQKGLPPVNEETVLFKEDRHSVGKIFEVFGPVSHPFYVIQFNSPEHIESKGIKMHDPVYFAPSVESFTQYIFPEKLKQDRGSDASWKNDEEPPPEALEFSDDEKERAAKQQKKSQNVRRKKFRSQQENSNENGVNYQPRQQYPLDYSSGCRGEPNPTFSRSRFPHSSASPRFFRQQPKTRQRYSSDYSELRSPSAFCQQQRQESLRRHQYSFPPPSFETVSNEANFPPPSVTWGWPRGCTQNIYDPLLSLLSLPPPPPPPLPPPSAAPPP